MSVLSRVAMSVSVAALLAGCGRRDDGSISADPDAKLHAGFPVVYAAPPPPVDVGSPVPSQQANPLAMNALKHDGPAAAAAGAQAAQPADPCAVKDPKGPLAMRLRHDGPADANRRNPLCMRLK